MSNDSGSVSWLSSLRSVFAWSLSLLGLNWLMGALLGKKKKHRAPAVAQTPSSKQDDMQAQAETLRPLRDRIEGTLYGNCIGDAIGLLTEFMNKEGAKKEYGEYRGQLEFKHKVNDFHRHRWEIGDWTDDSDQMILIMQSLSENKGQANQADFGKKLKDWIHQGFPDLGDQGGCGIGATTYSVVSHKKYDKHPAKAAEEVWLRSNRRAAPNGGVMRTSVVGAYKFHDLKTVRDNTLAFCKVTHADPRCQASCVAVTTAIALMLQGEHRQEDGQFDVETIIQDSLKHAIDCMDDQDKDYDMNVSELERHINAKSLEDLLLDESDKIGYTYKCMGAGFWALRQTDFREALEAITYEAGDADTNGAVAGALLGCKLGKAGLPESWLNGLANQEWLKKQIETYIQLVFSATNPKSGKSGPEQKKAKMQNDDADKVNKQSTSDHISTHDNVECQQTMDNPDNDHEATRKNQQSTIPRQSKYDSVKYQSETDNRGASPDADDENTEDVKQKDPFQEASAAATDQTQPADGATTQPQPKRAVDADDNRASSQDKGFEKQRESDQPLLQITRV